MQLAKVVGNLVSTHKNVDIKGKIFLNAEKISLTKLETYLKERSIPVVLSWLINLVFSIVLEASIS